MELGGQGEELCKEPFGVAQVQGRDRVQGEGRQDELKVQFTSSSHMVIVWLIQPSG